MRAADSLSRNGAAQAWQLLGSASPFATLATITPLALVPGLNASIFLSILASQNKDAIALTFDDKKNLALLRAARRARGWPVGRLCSVLGQNLRATSRCGERCVENRNRLDSRHPSHGCARRSTHVEQVYRKIPAASRRAHARRFEQVPHPGTNSESPKRPLDTPRTHFFISHASQLAKTINQSQSKSPNNRYRALASAPSRRTRRARFDSSRRSYRYSPKPPRRTPRAALSRSSTHR